MDLAISIEKQKLAAEKADSIDRLRREHSSELEAIALESNRQHREWVGCWPIILQILPVFYPLMLIVELFYVV